jgi:hypothetical protein
MDAPLDAALTEELKRFSAVDAHGEVCVLNDGKLLRPAARPEAVALTALDEGAARATIDFVIATLKDERGVHAETAVAFLSAVLGRALLAEYRAEWEKVDPKFTAIFIEDLNQDLFLAAQFLGHVCSQKLPGPLTVAAEIPEENRPDPQALPASPAAWKKLESGMAAAGTMPSQGRWILAYALALLLEMTAQALPTATALRIALRSLVRSAKTPDGHLAALKD